MKFQIIDAFTDEIFGGNPAGVVLLDKGQDFPADEVMVKTAAELRYSETAFIKKINEKGFRIRYFTPAAEVDLCGHATIGSFGALLEWGMAEDGAKYELHTLAGTLEVEIAKGRIFMEMAAPENKGVIDGSEEITALAQVMGIKTEDIVMKPALVSTGLPDIMLCVKSQEVLHSICPDFPALAKLSERQGAVGVHAFALGDPDSGVAAHCRNFAPLYAIDEEAATGTSNGAMTYYLYEKGLLKQEETYLFLQGEAMNRPSKIMSRLSDKNGKIVIQVGGVYKRLVQGEIYL